MNSKRGRTVIKIEVPTDSVPEFELGDTAAGIQQGRREKQKKGRKRYRDRGRRRPGRMKLHTRHKGKWQKSIQAQTEVTQKQRLE